MASPIANKLLNWYPARRRTLPWREDPQPYAVWVAEIMAQQTRLETMLPYFERWMARFPDVHALAAAEQQEVLSLWEGLGYYTRARNLHKAARMLVDHYRGELPDEATELRKLPGIGPYTAGAIASVAFGYDEAIVDGNVARVMARLFDIQEPLGSSAATKRFWELARQHLPPGEAADYNQALMDLGATVCTPRNPDCDDCPLQTECMAFKLGIQEQRPVRKDSKAPPTRHYASAIVENKGYVLLVRRPEEGLLGGMWEFPSVELQNGDKPESGLHNLLVTDFGLDATLKKHTEPLEHTYSHFHARLQAFRVTAESRVSENSKGRELAWVAVDDLDDYPMGKLDRQIARGLADG